MPMDIGFFLSISGLNVFFPQYFWYGPDAFWFVGLIMQMYVLFPILFWLLLKLGQLRFISLIIGICFVSRAITSLSDDSYIYLLGLSSNRLIEFGLGMMLGIGQMKQKGFQLNWFSIKNKVFIILTLASLTGTYFIYHFVPQSNIIKIISIDGILCFTAFNVIALMTLIIRSNTSFIYKILIYISGIAYSIYLVHSPPIRPAFQVFQVLGIKSYVVSILLYTITVIIISSLLTALDSRLWSYLRPKLIKSSLNQ